MSRTKGERGEKAKYRTIGGQKDGVVIGSKAKEAKSDEQSKRLVAAERRKEHKERFQATGAIAGQKLYAPKRDGFHRRWINDERGRVENMEDKGYTHVHLSDKDARLTASSNQGGKTCKRVGLQETGEALYAYLMEIPMEFHNQDRQGNLDSIAAQEKGLLNGNMQNPDSKIWSGEVQFN